MILYVLFILATTQAWQFDINAKAFIDYKTHTVPKFISPTLQANASAGTIEYFRLLEFDRNQQIILVGGRNAIYELYVANLQENFARRIQWPSMGPHQELCILKGKNEKHDCQNYIRIFGRISDTKFLTCGTNSFKPLCRVYEYGSKESNQQAQTALNVSWEKDAQGQCPYDPRHNSTYLFINEKELYSATVADFQGGHVLIYRAPLRTELYDLRQLNFPHFVKSLDFGDFVLFLFREVGLEENECSSKDIKKIGGDRLSGSGRGLRRSSVYSRLGKVCKNDKGGPHPHNERWTSFMKMQLNCAIPGDLPFYFDEIQSASDIIATSKNSSYFYGVFTTPDNAIAGSAVCMYDIKAAADAFNYRAYSGSAELLRNSAETSDKEIISDLINGKCLEDSRTIPRYFMNFILNENPLLPQPINSVHQQPIFVRVNLRYRLTAIAVDAQVQTLYRRVDVLFVGTTDGHLVKFFNAGADKNVKTIVVTESKALPSVPVRELLVAKRPEGSPQDDSIVVIGDNQIVTLPLHACNEKRFGSCHECLNLQDPYCVWDIKNSKCTSVQTLPMDMDNDGNLEISNKHNYMQQLENATQIPIMCGSIKPAMQSTESPYVEMSTSNYDEIHRGTVSSVGRGPVIDSVIINGAPEILTINQNGLILNGRRTSSDDEDQVIAAKTASNHGFMGFVLIATLFFLVGGILGFILSKNKCIKTPTFLDSSYGTASNLHPFNASAELNPLENNHLHKWLSNPTDSRNNEAKSSNKKDVNLLIQQPCREYDDTKEILNTPSTATTTNFIFGFDKDRSHECKNSTEALDEKLPQINADFGTLPKTKKTYL